MPDDSKPQLVARAAAILRAIAALEPEGGSTAGIARAAGLARPTAHRVLSALAEQGLVDRDKRSARWTLGPELYLLGTLAAARYDITDQAGGVLRRLARDTGESAFLSARRGDETVCLAAEEGTFPLRSHVLHIGIRFPLGVASAGLVLLAHLPDREIDEYLARSDLTGAWGPAHGTPALRTRLAEVRRDGYATNPGLIVEGSWGMAAAVFDRRDEPAWALSLTGVETRFGDVRRRQLGELLLQSAHDLGQSLR
ncbi:IclR family transcriptional regulator [Nocardia sp. BMG111209]|uniref:IclR family transcriptional regulator n=1 Tax=Nocardia sp. BMG111209 TaxID=1160137 RepID=UPI00036BB84F|nr:IclR family transcriptional regulator [Nocardia sp. BMG111209]